MAKLVRKRFTSPPVLPSTSRRRLLQLARRPDHKIDFSDIPPLPADFGRHARRNPVYGKPRKALTLHLDADVVEWLQGSEDYNEALNVLLRECMEHKR